MAANKQTEHGAGFGVALTLGAFTLWGMFPLYFVALSGVDPTEVLVHRIVGSAIILAVAAAFTKRLSALLAEVRDWKRLGFYLITSLLVSTNWLIYIWATQNNHVIDASLGYYINPLVTVVLAMLFLGERLSRPQWIAVGIATLGVSFSVLELGQIPWIALSLAASFGSYGLLRKRAGVDPVNGLLIETALLVPLALGWMLYLMQSGSISFLQGNARVDWLLAIAGLVTVTPLALWLSGMRYLKLSTVGLLQYITPTLQFLLGLTFGEPLSDTKLLTFVFIWVALVIYTSDSLKRHRREKAAGK